jgi:ribosomal protein S18 acetylase RimI-like enzyme
MATPTPFVQENDRSLVPVSVRAATVDDVPGIAAIFGRAFEDYRRGFGVGPETLARLWEGSLAARVASTLVAVLDDGSLAGFAVYVRPGQKEQYGGRDTGLRRFRLMRVEVGLGKLLRLPLLFIPMGLAYVKRRARADELYVSLIGVDPSRQAKGIGQMLLSAVEAEARACGAAGILLHTASTNRRARQTYNRAGYELVCTVKAPWRGPADIPAYVAYRKPLGP